MEEQSLTQAEEKKVILPPKAWPDTFALKITNEDYNKASQYRHSNEDPRWAIADRVYLASGSQKMWPGSRTPKANIPVYLSLKQIESLMPRYMDIFADSPWADIDPQPGTDNIGARLHRDLVLWQFDQFGPNGEPGGREQSRRAFHSKLMYGKGVVEAGWMSFTKKTKKWIPFFTRQKRRVFHPILGLISLPIGPLQRKVREEDGEEIINRPFIKYIPLGECYFDPNQKSPVIQDGRFFIRRQLISIKDLDQYRGREDEGFHIPSNMELLLLSPDTPVTQADTSRQTSEAIAGTSWNPADPYSSDPAQKQLELRCRYSADRIVWVLNEKHVIYNQPNPFGMINFFCSFHIDTPNRSSCLAITDLTEGDQQLSREMIEGRINEASLGIYRGVTKKSGRGTPNSMLRPRPGIVREAESPKDDIVFDDILNVSQQFYLEVQAADLRSQGTTGVTDLAVSGGAPTQGNSANRTATGVNTQAGAAGKRHTYNVEIDEYTFLEPILNLFARMNNDLLDPEEKVRWGMKEAEGSDIKNARVSFKLRAGTRARSKTSILQALPMISQMFFNPQFQQMANQQGRTIDFDQFLDLLMDALDIRPRGSLMRDLTDEEKQKLGQPPPEEMIRMQMQRERLQGQVQTLQIKGQQDQENIGLKGQQDMLKEIVKQTIELVRDEEKGKQKAIGTKE